MNINLIIVLYKYEMYHHALPIRPLVAMHMHHTIKRSACATGQGGPGGAWDNGITPSKFLAEIAHSGSQRSSANS